MSIGALDRNLRIRPPRHRRRLDTGINLTPMLDVIFNLIFFFLLTTTIRQEMTQLPVQLPEAASAQRSGAEMLPTLVIDREGQMYFDQQPVAEAELGLLLNDLAARGGRQLRLRGDERANWGLVVRVMDLCRQAGLSLQAETQPDGPLSRRIEPDVF